MTVIPDPVTAGLNAAEKVVELANKLIGLYEHERDLGESEHEVDAVTRALGIEVAVLAMAVHSRLKWFRGELDRGWLPPLVPFYTDAYDQLRVHLQRLPPHVVAAVVHFHGYLRFVNGLQQTREEYLSTGRPQEFQKVYVSSLVKLGEIGWRTVSVFASHSKLVEGENT